MATDAPRAFHWWRARSDALDDYGDGSYGSSLTSRRSLLALPPSPPRMWHPVDSSATRARCSPPSSERNPSGLPSRAFFHREASILRHCLLSHCPPRRNRLRRHRSMEASWRSRLLHVGSFGWFAPIRLPEWPYWSRRHWAQALARSAGCWQRRMGPRRAPRRRQTRCAAHWQRCDSANSPNFSLLSSSVQLGTSPIGLLMHLDHNWTTTTRRCGHLAACAWCCSWPRPRLRMSTDHSP